jgi:hypothetical protein
VVDERKVIIQLARGGAVDRQFSARPPQSVANGAVVVEHGPADTQGDLEPPPAGQVVLSLPSPEGLGREPAEVRRVITRAGAGVEPLVVVVEAAEELREDQLAAIVDAAGHTSRAVILRILRDV